MGKAKKKDDPLPVYREIPSLVRAALAGVPEEHLDAARGSSEMSPREIVHHLVEANIVAASMMIAALGSDKATFDWSWLWPDRNWCDRMKYADLPLEPAIDTLTGLMHHVSGMIAARNDALDRSVTVFDSPGAKPYQMTVGQILQQEADHAVEHLSEIRPSIL